jgi:hypothetical protein
MRRQAENCAKAGRNALAATWVEIAALHACSNHCGIFTDPVLERILSTVGQAVPDPSRTRQAKGPDRLKPGGIVLHIATAVAPVGGLTRFLVRWIKTDGDHRHDVALTRQTHGPLPDALTDGIRASGGRLHLVNRTIGSLLDWAAELRKIAAEADLIVLHIGNHDVVPLLALARREHLPPVLLINHCDHLFWLGASVADQVVSFRDAGRNLCIERRGIDPCRAVVLPLLVEEPRTEVTCATARKALGLPHSAVILLSVARGAKYQPWRGSTFARAHIPVLRKNANAILIVVGTGGQWDWSRESADVGGRILCLPELEHPELYFKAADIYVDSFPYCSVTSLLEAGMYAMPLVGRFPSEHRVPLMAGFAPGTIDRLVQTTSLEAYHRQLHLLIGNPRHRRALGEATREKIRRLHSGTGWLAALNDLYRAANELPGTRRRCADTQTGPNMALPDTLLPTLGNWNADPHVVELACMRPLPLTDRLRQLFRIMREGCEPRLLLRHGMRALVPEWLIVRLRGLRPFGRQEAGTPSAAGVTRARARPDRSRQTPFPDPVSEKAALRETKHKEALHA